MGELLILTLIIFAFYLASVFVQVDNAFAEFLVNLTPVIIPTAFMWVRRPKHYLKFLSFRSTNIQYQIDIRLADCNLSKSHFSYLVGEILKTDQLGKGRVIKEQIGDLKYHSYLQVNTAGIQVTYDLPNDSLLVTCEHQIKYKSFFRLAESLLASINKVFSSSTEICYDSEKLSARLQIKFIDKPDKDCGNPFWEDLFKGFRNKIVEFKYKGSANSYIAISTDAIEFTNKDLKNLTSDIKKELTFITLRN